MEEYKKQVETFAQEDCNTRMYVISGETRIPLETIRGYIEILQQIDISQTEELPGNFGQILERIANAEAKLSIILSTLATYDTPIRKEPCSNGGG